MRTKLLLSIFILPFICLSSDTLNNNFSSYFSKAYQLYPEIPKGILEAVSFSYTRIQHITHSNSEPESCTGIPNTYGVMGLTLDGKSYFKNNLLLVSELSEYATEEIIQSPEKNILAYAKAFSAIKKQLNISTSKPEDHIAVLVSLSELPDKNITQNFALNSQLYEIYVFLNDPQKQLEYAFPIYTIDFISLFGKENYSILSSSEITITDKEIKNQRGASYQNNSIKSSDYAPAIWNPAATCNYSSRSGTAITAVTIHTVQGTYAGCISWFKDCSAVASAHYVVRSSDGQVTQMVLEEDKAWHVKSENPYTIGIEHEGYVNNAAWYTNAMYNASAAIVRDITQSGYGINPLRTYFGPGCSGSTPQCYQGACTKIKGHQMFPSQNHTDPGPNWNWALYYLLINNNPSVNTITAPSGNFYDSGGNNANYTNDERILTLIQPTNASSVTLNFSAFNIELNYDYLFIYDGATTSAPLIGTYTGTNNPGSITSSTGSLLIEFRSDCATSSPGWSAQWQGNYISTNTNELIRDIESINLFPNPFSNTTTLNYYLIQDNFISISIQNALGKEIITYSEKQMKGNNSFIIDANDLNLSCGIYFISIKSPNQKTISKMIVN